LASLTDKEQEAALLYVQNLIKEKRKKQEYEQHQPRYKEAEDVIETDESLEILVAFFKDKYNLSFS